MRALLLVLLLAACTEPVNLSARSGVHAKPMTLGAGAFSPNSGVTLSSSDARYPRVDVTIPTAPIGTLAPVGATSSFAIAANGDMVYLLSNADKTLFAIDVTTPTAPTLVGSIITDTNPRDLVVGGNFVYVTGDTGVGRVMRAYDVSNPTVIVAGTNAVGCGQSQGIALQGRFVACGDRGGQTTWYDVSNPNTPVTAVLSPSTFPAQGLRFYGRFTVSADSTNGNLKVYDPYANAIVSTLGGFSSPRALEVLGEYAYFLETSGLKFHIINLTNPAVPVIASTTSVASAPNALAVTGHTAYVGITNAVLVYNVTSPSSPVSLGSIPVTGIVRGLALVGDNLFVASASSPYLQVFAVSNTSIEQMAVGGLAARRIAVTGDISASDERLSGGLYVEQTMSVQRAASFGGNASFSGTIKSTAAAVTSVTAGTCSSETCTSTTCTDTRGQTTSTCTAGQTTQVTFSGTHATAPTCVCTPANAAADIVTLGEPFCDASTTVLTITFPNATTASAVNYHCID